MFDKKEWFSIPNLISYFRIALIPVFVWIYISAKTANDFYLAAFVILLSGLSDLLDGKIARRFNMITELGKALDPFADKLTQGALVICLYSRFKQMWILIVLWLVKEGFMLLASLFFWRKGRKLDGAKWFGKVCTVVLYAVMFVLIAYYDINQEVANVLIWICAGFMIMAFLLYIPEFMQLRKPE